MILILPPTAEAYPPGHSTRAAMARRASCMHFPPWYTLYRFTTFAIRLQKYEYSYSTLSRYSTQHGRDADTTHETVFYARSN